MKAMKFAFILVWWVSFAYLMVNLGSLQPQITLIFFALFVLTVLNNFSERLYRKDLTKKIVDSLDKIDLNAMEKKMRSLKQTASDSKCKELDEKLKAMEKDREKKYRDLVRKVLDLDNQLNKKYRMLSEAVVKINRKLGG